MCAAAVLGVEVTLSRYRVLLLKDSKVPAYREASPREGKYRLHRSHYEPAGEIEAPSPYSAWQRLQEKESARRGFRPLGVGDALESDGAALVVCNFWGFDQAEWQIPQAEEGALSRRGDDPASDKVPPVERTDDGSDATPATSLGA